MKAEIEIIADSPDFDYANWYKEAVAIFHPYDSTYYAFAKKCTTSIKIKVHRGQEQRKEIFRKLNMVMSLFAKQAGWVRVSVQGVKSLGGHSACLCREFDFYEVKKNI